MFVGEDQAAPVQAAAVVDQGVVHGSEHVDVYLAQIEFLELYAALVRIVKERVLSQRDRLSSGAVILLALLITQVIGRTYLRIVVHQLCPYLHLDVAP